ncbi:MULTISPECIES: hypothetical protein [Pseudomonas]|uniref:Uncharacterized protein n=1 Tax=Pseudomonas quercus TaxID=2722792 RepID=A0ABX0YNF7_9PSED|nr:MULTISPECIES: hypothetical protein [Pseudomonas]MBF7143236.1 hypothetical protein [Pseudomonas sp. LY10J]NJP03413.1 hypothetical protein [Pseudomonas quercus]
MKRIILIGVSLLLTTKLQAACNDRYYYYKPELTTASIKKWQVYEDRGFIKSREMEDIKQMVKVCGSPPKGSKYNLTAIVNMLVSPSFYKLKNPLFTYPNILLPNGINGGQSAYLDIRKKPGLSNVEPQHAAEINIGSNTGLVQIYLVRDGIDEIKTPEWFYKNHSYLGNSEYRYTTFR